MQVKPVLIILLISSSLLLLPITKPNTEITLFPFEKRAVIINLQTSKVSVTSGIEAQFTLNFSRLDPQKNSIEHLFDGEVLTTWEFELELRGNYLFEFLIESLTIATITIDQFGLPTSSIIYIIGIMIVSLAYFLKRLIFPPLDV